MKIYGILLIVWYTILKAMTAATSPGLTSPVFTSIWQAWRFSSTFWTIGELLFLEKLYLPLKSWARRVRPRLVWRNATSLASRVVHGVTVHIWSCEWNRRVFPDDALLGGLSSLWELAETAGTERAVKAFCADQICRTGVECMLVKIYTEASNKRLYSP